MKLSKKAILFLSFLLISFCGNNDEINESTNNSNLQTPNEKVEDSNQEENSSQEKGSSLQEAIDEIIQEPLGGAHRDYDKSLSLLGDSIELQLNELLKLDPQELKIIKQNKYLKIT